MPATAAATTTFKALRIIDIDRLSSLLVRTTSNSPAALMMPADEACFDQEEYAIEGVAEDRQREDTSIHLGDFEGPLRQQDEVAETVVRYDHLAENRQDQRDRETDSHPGQDLRAGGRNDELADGLQRGEAQRARRVELNPIDRSHAAEGVEQDREQGGHEDQDDLHLVADADEQHEHREISRTRNRPQHFDQRLEQIVERPVVAHRQPERDTEHDREAVTQHLPPERCDQMEGQRSVRDVLQPRLE